MKLVEGINSHLVEVFVRLIMITFVADQINVGLKPV